jgi:hypothetical protein
MIAELTLTHHMVEETMTMEQMVEKLYSNGFSGGIYGDNCLYADTVFKDETENLQRLFPRSQIKRYTTSGITIIRL